MSNAVALQRIKFPAIVQAEALAGLRLHIFTDRTQTPAALAFFLLGMQVKFASFEIAQFETRREVPGETASLVLLRRPERLNDETLTALIVNADIAVTAPLAAEQKRRLGRLGLNGVLEFPTQAGPLRAQILALATRAPLPQDEAGQIYACGAFRFDPSARRIDNGASNIDLTIGETRVLRTLLLSPNLTVPRASLEHFSGRSKFNASSRSLDVMISTIRRKFRDIAINAEILSIKSVGYRLAGDWRCLPMDDADASLEPEPGSLLIT